MKKKPTRLRFSWLLGLCFLMLQQGLAQNTKTIQGKVSGAAGDTVLGASISVKGTRNGTTTDATGMFTLGNVTDASVLVVSSTGYAPVELVVGGRSIVNVILQTQASSLEDVVVIGYGSQSRRNVTSSVSTVRADKLVVAPVASVTNAIVGRLPGLTAKQTSGQPGGDGAAISIRGFGPALVIVDGVESSINNIDPSQIESFSILKDGAASIYGSRAGNGVILITTKRGTSGKPVISLNTTYSLQGVTQILQPANSPHKMELENELDRLNGVPLRWQQSLIDSHAKYVDNSNLAYPNTDWYKVAFRDWAPQQQHNISVRGGSDRIRYFGLVGYTDQETMIRTNGGGYKRYNVQSNIDANITKNLTLRFDFFGSFEDRLFPRRGIGTSAGFESDAWQDLYTSLPYFPATLPDPTKLSYANDVGNIAASTNIDVSGYYMTKTRDYRGAIGLDYKLPFVPGLSANAFVNYRDQSNFLKTFTKTAAFFSYNPANDAYTQRLNPAPANLSEQYITTPTVTQNYSLNYRNTFGGHQVSALALLELINYRSDNFAAFRPNFLTPTIDQLFNGSTTGATAGGGATEMGRRGLLFRANYNFRSKYLLEAILRADASAKFSPNKRVGYFPSVSAGWVLTQENFMRNVGFVNNLKLRASYGVTGYDDIGNFQYLTGYNIGSLYPFNSLSQQGIVSRGIAQEDFTWESLRISNIGLDFTLLKRKLYGSFDAFYRLRENILGRRVNTVPSTFGANLPTENLNSSNDRGFEFVLGTTGTIGRSGGFSYDVSANISWSRSKWKNYDEPATWSSEDQKRINKRSGEWVDRAFGYVFDGLIASQDEVAKLPYTSIMGVATSTLRPGDVKYKDVNGDGKIDVNDQVEIGKGTIPHWLGGLTMDLRFKNFDFSALLQGAFGYSQYVNLRGRYTGVFTEKLYKERWTPENPNANALVPRLAGPNGGNNRLYSDYYVKNQAYVRLKTFALGYTLPKSLLNVAGISQFRLYVAGTNLLTWNKLARYDFDPEAPTEVGTGDLIRNYPNQRLWSFGLNVSF